MSLAIEVDRLSFRYRDQSGWALQGLDFSASYGEVHGIAGHNGAGKTTLLLLIAGLALPTKGSVLVDGHHAHNYTFASDIGLLTDRINAYGEFTVEETCRILAKLQRLDEIETVEEALDLLGLEGHRCKRVRQLSSGLRKRLMITLSTINNPRIALLDEPFAGIDPESVALISEVLKEWRREGRCVLISSHNLPELAEISDKITIIRTGTALASGTLTALRGLVESQMPWVAVKTRLSDHRVPMTTYDLHTLFQELDSKAEQIEDISIERMELPEIYKALYRDDVE